MAPAIGIAMTPQTVARPGAAPPAATPSPGGAIALAAFSRDRALFDGGAAFGRAEAAVPLRGTATPGAAVEARAVTEGGEPVTPWTPLGAAGADGAWAGALAVPRRPEWLRPEVRLAAEPDVSALGAHRFGVGHVLAIWGQSEIHQMLLANQDQAGREALLDDDAVQIVWHDRAVLGSGAAGVRHKHLTAADPHTGAVSAMANALLATRPGEKFCLVFQVVQGTGFNDLLDDSLPEKRRWEDDAAIHAFATADGQRVGAAAASWFAQPAGLAAGYEAALMPAFTGRDKDGRPVPIPGTHSYVNPVGGQAHTLRYDHWFGELYDPAHTRWVPYGPHRFEPLEDMRNAVTRADAEGSTAGKLLNIERCRRSWREMAANPHAEGLFLPIAVEPLNYLNGEQDAGGSWGDITHPAADTPDGLGRLGRLTAHAYLRSTGLTDWPIPEFDGCAWEPSGAWVELWCSAGPVTTTRRARGLPPLPKTLPHWTEVVGFEIDGRPAQRAEITPEGRVRVHPLDGAFTARSTLTFGAGGATGALNGQADLSARLWMDLPIVAVPVAGLEGIAVRPLPDPALLASTVSTGGGGAGGGATGPTAFFTRDGSNAHFAGPTLGAGVSGLTFELVVRLREQTVTGTPQFVSVTSDSISVHFDTRAGKRQIRVTVEDATGARMISGAYSDVEALPLDRWATIRVSAMHDRGDGTGFARVFVDGAQAFPPPGNEAAGRFATSATPTFAANRSFELLRVGGLRLDVARVAIWKTARPDGAAPAEPPFKLIEGGAAAANADPWKQGTDLFT